MNQPIYGKSPSISSTLNYITFVKDEIVQFETFFILKANKVIC